LYPWDEELEQYADEAYLHYEPENDIDSLPPTTHIQPPSPINPSPKRRPKKPKSRSRSPAGTSTTAPRRKKKTATAKKQPEFDEEWDKDLRNRIVQDTALHLRILRLEPIHFDVFLSMVDGQAEGRSAAKLKLHLREFLDKQAINFYGAEPVGRRKR